MNVQTFLSLMQMHREQVEGVEAGLSVAGRVGVGWGGVG